MGHLAAAREFLPWWAVWGPHLFLPLVIFIVAFLFTGLALAWPMLTFERNRHRPWPERARWAYPTGVVMQGGVLLLTFCCALSASLSLSLIVPHRWVVHVLVAVTALLGTTLAAHLAARRLLPGRLRFSDWPKSLLVLVAFNGWLFLAIAVMIGVAGHVGAWVWAVIGFGAVGVLLLSAGYGFWLLRAFGVIHAPTERLRRIAEQVAATQGRPRPAVFVLDVPGCNAFALPLLGWLLYTRELEAVMTDAELETISAHELAHLAESNLLLLARMVPTISLLPLLALSPALMAFGPLAVPALLLPFLVSASQSGRLSRWLERAADSAGTSHEADAGIHARALEKLYEANLAPAVMPGLGGSHTHLYDRMLAAGLTPTYERPRPPSRWRAALPICGTVLLLLVVVAGLAPPTRTMLFGPGGIELARLSDASQGERAATLYQAAMQLDIVDVRIAVKASITLSLLRRCDEAEAMADEADHRCQARGSHGEDVALVEAARAAVRWCRGQKP